ncbi:hypothetical protein GGF32_008097 [Allomyces javanicus]|nr:hypothetical protein GGF32_008097 [Allomyces javanicus]
MFSRLAHRLYSTAAAAPPTVLEYRVPYFVHRTKPGLQLPVYPRYTFKGTQCATFVRRIEGNGKVFTSTAADGAAVTELWGVMPSTADSDSVAVEFAVSRASNSTLFTCGRSLTLAKLIALHRQVLADQIRAEFPDWTVAYNTTTNQIKIKGYVVPQLRQFLTERGF